MKPCADTGRTEPTRTTIATPAKTTCFIQP